MSERECSICFDRIEHNNYITCKNKSCVSVVCPDCMESYINFSITNNHIPKCSNNRCGMYYLISDINRFPHLLEPYAKSCFNELLGQYGDEARKIFEINNNIETLKRVRETFISERFPIAISYTASVIMPHKLRRLDKQITDKIKQETLNTNRICMNLTCSGSLNENFVCLSCGTTFCMECETRKDASHVCNLPDIESVRAIRGMIHCPNCHLPIIKSQGCNNMTCASCGQLFLYNTGEAGGGGSHVSKIESPKSKYLLSNVYNDYLISVGLLPLILRIEELQPSNTDSKILSNILINYYKNNNSCTQLELELSHAFENYITKVYTNKRYHQALGEIESHIASRTISSEYLLQMLNILLQKI